MTYIERRLEPELRALIGALPAVAITGPRGAGKTTLAMRVANDILRLDDPNDANLLAADPDAVLAVRDAPLLVDEWQQVPEVLAAIKRAVDRDPRPGRFVLTGSVRGELTVTQWPGTGRVVPLRLFGLHPLETEVAGHADPAWPRPFIDRCFDTGRSLAVASREHWTLPRYVERALNSGFPAVATVDSRRIRDRWLGGYVEQLLERDVIEVASRIDTRQLRRYAEAVAGHTSTDIATATLAEAAGTTAKTAAGYWNLLERLFVVHDLPAWHSNRLKRLTKAGKRHLVEPALVRPLLRVDVEGVLRDATLLGRVLESWVAIQLVAETHWCDPSARVFHLRTHDRRREIDLVIEGANGRLVAVEVKAGAGPKPQDARHLLWFRDQVGDRLARAVLLHTGPHAFRLADGVDAAPIAALWSD